MKPNVKNLLSLSLMFIVSVIGIAGCGSNDTQSFSETLKKRTESINRKWLDVSYSAQSSAQKLDLYLPNEGEGPFPVIIYIHGGGFTSGDKAEGHVLPLLAGLDRGYAIVSTNYRLSNEAVFPAQIYDIKAAIRFLKANASEYKINPDKIAVWGSSSGGWVAAMMGTSAGVSELEDLSMGNPDQSSAVKAVVDWCGPINLGTMDEQFTKSGTGSPTYYKADSSASRALGHPLPDVPELVKAANPETYISVDDAAFFIQHGDKDQIVPVEQSIDFAAKLESVLGKDKVTLEILPGAIHGDSALNKSDNITKILDFLDRNLK